MPVRRRGAGGDRAGGVGGPLGPGAGVERGGDAGDLQGQHLVGAGDPRAAVDADGPVALPRPERGEPLGEPFGRKVAAVLGDVLGGRGGDGPGDVAADPVDGLDVAPVALGRPGVQEQSRTGEGGGPVRVQGGQGARLRPEIALGGVRDLGGEVAGPRGEPAVQDPDVRVARPAQQPPGAGGGPALSPVVDHDRGVLADPRPAHHGAEGLRVREGVAAAAARRSGQLRVEVDEDGTGEVARLVVGAAVRTTQLPADVQEDRGPRSRRLAGVFGCGDDGLHGCHPRAEAVAPVPASVRIHRSVAVSLQRIHRFRRLRRPRSLHPLHREPGEHREPRVRGAAGAARAPGGASICTGCAVRVPTRDGRTAAFPCTATTTVRGETRR